MDALGPAPSNIPHWSLFDVGYRSRSRSRTCLRCLETWPDSADAAPTPTAPRQGARTRVAQETRSVAPTTCDTCRGQSFGSAGSDTLDPLRTAHGSALAWGHVHATQHWLSCSRICKRDAHAKRGHTMAPFIPSLHHLQDAHACAIVHRGYQDLGAKGRKAA